MRLEDIIDNRATDKNTTHSYLAVYQKLFEDKQNTVKNVLEIGLGHGGSIKLWNDYFPNTEVYVLDINTSWGLRCDISSPRIHLQLRDAYTQECLEEFGDIRFDIMIDDGPHTLESMKFFVKNYSRLLNDDGILIVEDIPELEWTTVLQGCVSDDMIYETYDRRHLKNRFDDIMFVVRRKPKHI